MQKYIILTIHRAEELLPDYHDISYDDMRADYEKIRKFAKKLGATTLAGDSINDLFCDDSYAEVEHNFDLTDDQKRQLVELIKPLFNDGYFGVDGDDVTLEIGNNGLKAVKFIKTDGDLFLL